MTREPPVVPSSTIVRTPELILTSYTREDSIAGRQIAHSARRAQDPRSAASGPLAVEAGRHRDERHVSAGWCSGAREPSHLAVTAVDVPVTVRVEAGAGAAAVDVWGARSACRVRKLSQAAHR